MIISLGILSLLQLTLVPGLILVKLFKIRGFWENLIAAVGLSQLFNYLVVIIATLCKIYTQTTMLILFGVELVILIVLYFSNLHWKIGKIIHPNAILLFFQSYIEKIPEKTEWKKKLIAIIYYLIFGVAVISLIRYFFLYVAHPTEIFSSWDAVVSWNKWATEWFHGILPAHTWHYPQLIPTNLSIPYQFIGTTDVQYFSKYFANLIELLIVFIIFLLGLKKKDVAYFLGVFFTSWLMIGFGSRGNGYADSPVAFWALLSVACLLLAEDSENEKSLLLLGAFFVSGAALTKQAGLWMVLVYPILLLLRQTSKPKKSSIIILQTVIVMALIIIPWYLFKEIQIRTGVDTSEIKYVTSLVAENKTFFQIINAAYILFVETIKNIYISKQITFILLIILLALSYKDYFWRKICCLVVIPFWIGWVFFFSYENRNLVMVIPLLAITAGIGFRNLIFFDWIKVKSFFLMKIPFAINQFIAKQLKWLFRLFSSMRVWYFLLIIPLLFVLPHWVPDNRLVKNSLIKQRYIGDPQINELIYNYNTEYGLNGKIVTDYQYLGFLPELEKYYTYFPSELPEFIERFNDPEVGYALLNNHWWSEDTRDYVMSLITEGKINLIFQMEPISKNGTFYFVTTCHGVCKK